MGEEESVDDRSFRRPDRCVRSTLNTLDRRHDPSARACLVARYDEVTDSVSQQRRCVVVQVRHHDNDPQREGDRGMNDRSVERRENKPD